MLPETPQSSPFAKGLSARELLAADLPKPEMILDPIITQHGLTMLYGPRGLGKTFVALGLAWAAASGERFLKWHAARPRRVLYIDGEMAAAEIKERLRRLGPAPDNLHFVIGDLNRDGLPDLADYDAQIALVRGWDPVPELLVLDNLSSLVGFRRNDPDS